MTEAEWLACTDPRPMLRFLRGRASDRKSRLFACECCRRIWQLFPDQRCRRAVKLAEAFAEGKGGIRRLRRIEGVGEYYYDNREDVPDERLGYYAGAAIFQLGQERLATDIVASATSGAVACSTLDSGGDRPAADAAKNGESTAQSHMLRDIFGNPFRSRKVDPVWRTPTVVVLAEAIYEDRTFDRVPVLADALQDAGCTDADILAHCRGSGPHVRGCWVIDLLTGRE